jgi:hypothetical protein
MQPKTLSFIVITLVLCTLSMGCMGVASIENGGYTPIRTSDMKNSDPMGNYVMWYPEQYGGYANYRSIDPTIDCFTVTMNDKTKTMYTCSGSPYMAIFTPASKKVHCSVDVTYKNGTMERIYEGDV